MGRVQNKIFADVEGGRSFNVTASITKRNGDPAIVYVAPTGSDTYPHTYTFYTEWDFWLEPGSYIFNVSGNGVTPRHDYVEIVNGDDNVQLTAGLDNISTVTAAQFAADPELLITGSINRNLDGSVSTASVTWPDGSTGTYTTTDLSSDFIGVINGYTVTKGSKTFTQPPVTRDPANGVITNRPAIVVS